MKATNAQILEAYAELASVKKVGQRFGMCGQSVHDRLVKLNASNPVRYFTKAEEDRLLRDYSRLADEGRVGELAKELGRTRHYLARQARRLGLTKRNRTRPYLVEPMRVIRKEWFTRNAHPRGMLGKTHSEETKAKFRDRIVSEETRQKFSDANLLRWVSMTKEQRVTHARRVKTSWKSGWRKIGGRKIFARSRWEANYARYLDWLVRIGNIAAWEHEPLVFQFPIKRGKRSFLPDFSVTELDGSIAYHEVKGWMDPRSLTKIGYMATYYPDVKLIVIGSKNYKALAKLVSRRIAGWETSP